MVFQSLTGITRGEGTRNVAVRYAPKLRYDLMMKHCRDEIIMKNATTVQSSNVSCFVWWVFFGGFLIALLHDPVNWGEHIAPKHQWTSIRACGVSYSTWQQCENFKSTIAYDMGAWCIVPIINSMKVPSAALGLLHSYRWMDRHKLRWCRCTHAYKMDYISKAQL